MVVKLSGCKRSFVSFVLAATAMQWTGLMVLPTPQAIAQTTAKSEILLEPSEDESYKVFIARAEANAAVRAQSLFDQDLLRTEVRVTVLGQRSAAIAPVLQLRVSRQEWTAYPDPEIWSVYYPESKSLLLFDEALPVVAEEPEEVADELLDELEAPVDEELPVDTDMPTPSPIDPLLAPVDIEPAAQDGEAGAEVESDTDDETPSATEETTEEENTTDEAEDTDDTPVATEEATDEPEEDEDEDDENDRPSRTVPTLVR